MKFVNVTNSHSRLVYSQLANTDAHLVKVYTIGKTTVIYTQAPTHHEILLVNKTRNIKEVEITESLGYFLKRTPNDIYEKSEISIIRMDGVVEISIPIHKPVVAE